MKALKILLRLLFPIVILPVFSIAIISITIYSIIRFILIGKSSFVDDIESLIDISVRYYEYITS